MVTKVFKNRIWKVTESYKLFENATTHEKALVYSKAAIPTTKEEDAVSFVLEGEKRKIRCPICGGSKCFSSPWRVENRFDDTCLYGVYICRRDYLYFIMQNKVKKVNPRTNCCFCTSDYITFTDYRSSESDPFKGEIFCNHCKQEYFLRVPTKLDVRSWPLLKDSAVGFGKVKRLSLAFSKDLMDVWQEEKLSQLFIHKGSKYTGEFPINYLINSVKHKLNQVDQVYIFSVKWRKPKLDKNYLPPTVIKKEAI